MYDSDYIFTYSVVDVLVIEVLEHSDGLSQFVVCLRIITASDGLLQQCITVARQLHITEHKLSLSPHALNAITNDTIEQFNMD